MDNEHCLVEFLLDGGHVWVVLGFFEEGEVGGGQGGELGGSQFGEVEVEVGVVAQEGGEQGGSVRSCEHIGGKMIIIGMGGDGFNNGEL